MDRELNEQVMIERVEMIARLTTEGTCQERDREIALNLIAEIARGNLIRNNAFTVVFSASPVPDRIKKEASVRVNITLDKDQLIGPSVVEAFQDELTRRIRLKERPIAKRWTISSGKSGKTRAGARPSAISRAVCCVRDCPSCSDSKKGASAGNSTVPGNPDVGSV